MNAASGRAIMAWFPATELGLALGIRQTAIPIGGALAAATLPALASAGGTRLAFLFLAGAMRDGSDRRGRLHPRPDERGARTRRRHPAAARPVHVAARDRHRPLPAGADRDHELRRPLPPRAPRRVEGGRRRGAGGDLRAGRRRAHRLGPDLRPARQPPPAAAGHRARARAVAPGQSPSPSTRRSRSSSRSS